LPQGPTAPAQDTPSVTVPPGPAPAPPSGPGVRLAPPEPVNPEAPRDANRLYPPQTKEPPRVSVPPAVGEERETPPLPVDIPQFALAKPRVASGQKPFPDGVAWLRARGYRTALHVLAPGEDDAADRRRFEKNGLRYLTLEVSPATLSREIVDRFNALVTDDKNLPLFVYDKDGALAGGLWYLHYRLADRLSDEKAAAQAARLGFKQDQEDEHRTMWLAVQKFLKDLHP